VSPEQLVAAFANSGTLLSAELEGRSFGGGVLELVPSEVARLRVPVVSGLAPELGRLDRLSRELQLASAEDAADSLIWETDLLLVKADVGVSPRLVEELCAARRVLLQRRLDRN
jgi:hypothetical protein